MIDPLLNHRAFEEFAQVLFSAPVRTPEQSMPAADPERPSDRPDGSLPRALVIDDVEQHLDRAVTLLSLVGFDTLRAASVTEALQVLKLHAPRLVLIDWVLPDGNGLVLAHAIRRMDTIQPVIVGLATLLPAEVRELALSTGFDAFCDKPLTLPALLGTLRGVGVLSATAKIATPVSEDVRGLSESRDPEPSAVCRGFVRDLLAESQKVVALVRARKLEEVGPQAERLLWRASLIGRMEFVDTVRAIQRAADARQGSVAAELAHTLDVDSRALAAALEQSLRDQALCA
ncbi:hypothetical protein DB347_09470 [Opitutaceae bacterium EW11]|nr:hypothetical protein DB347_09470 [Opitutaceae bacterium EW11]